MLLCYKFKPVNLFIYEFVIKMTNILVIDNSQS